MKARLVNLGVFATLLDVYSRFPQGGVEGDYVVVDGKELLWDKHRLRWGDAPRNDVTELRPDPSPYPGVPGGGVSSIELARLRSEVESLRDRVGEPNGIAPLDTEGLLPAKHLPPEANIEHRIRTELNDSISPLTARVLRLLQGDPSLQWLFVESATSARRVEHVVRYSNTYKKLSVPAGVIRHLTMGIEGVRPDRPLSDYKTWDIPGIEVDVDDAVRNLYVYARCSKTDNTGTFVTSDSFKPMEGEEGYYHLLVGMLSSLPNRVFTPLYGLVEIPAAALRIDKLISPDGEFVIDLVRKEIRGYKVSFTGGGASGGPDADTILEGILGQARSYTDDKTDGLKNYVDTKSSGARSYTDSKFTEAGRSLEDKATAVIATLQGYADGKMQEGREYTEAQIQALRGELTTGLSGVTEMNAKLERMQEQLDGKVSNWYYNGAPSATTPPTSQWTTEKDKKAHIGDTFTSLDKSPSPNAGKSWRYTPSYTWEEIVDSDSLKALQLAKEAKAAADGKTTTHLKKPTSYQVGDSWVMTEANSIGGVNYPRGTTLFAKEASTTFNALHWVRLDDYISAVEAKGYADGKAGEALNGAKQYADAGDKTTSKRIDSQAAATLVGAKNYTDSKHTEGKSYTDGKAGQAKSEAVAEAERKDGEVRKYADNAANQATNKAKSYTDEKVKAIEDNARLLDYLRTSITDGTTDIYGGLVLTSFIGARDPRTKQVRSFFAGSANTSLPAFAAGVTGFGTTGEKRVVEINHDGTGHWGQMEVMEGGKVLRIASMLFGGKLPDTYTHDFRTLELNDQRNERCRVYIGDDGALFFMGMWGASPRFVRISNKLNKPIVQIRGDIDISGALLGGRISAGNVSFEHKWGARSDRMSISRTGTGTYTVRHDLGHTRYSVLCMDAGNGRHNAKAGKITANSFEVYTKYDNTLYSDIDFTFLVFGDND
nr:MAG TPA: hypothetical protein [Caudoviricetes sp.]